MRTVNNKAENRLELYNEENKYVGMLIYNLDKKAENIIAAVSVKVFPGEEKKGYAGMLLTALVEDARKNGQKIEAVCPYVKHNFEKYSEKYQDVIYHG